MSLPQSEYRYDLLQRRWVIIASERGKRPDDFHSQATEPNEHLCPFCPGNEQKTPPDILSVSHDERPWSIRVVPNKFPALRVEGQPDREADGFYDRISGVGAHEVVIETADHAAIPERDPESLFQLFRVYRERLSDLMNDRRLKYVLVFKNHGAAAGASLSHPHSQIRPQALSRHCPTAATA